MKLQIAMISLNLKKKNIDICVLVLKVYIIFIYAHVYVHVCYFVVYQVGEGAPIPYLVCSIQYQNLQLTMK